MFLFLSLILGSRGSVFFVGGIQVIVFVLLLERYDVSSKCAQRESVCVRVWMAMGGEMGGWVGVKIYVYSV